MQSQPPEECPPSANRYAAPTASTPPHAAPLSNSPPSRNKHPRTTLLLIALLSGIAWRAELELTTGWASLKWIPQFHWAIPAGVLAFILWVLSVTRVPRPAAFAAALLMYSTVAYVIVERLLKTAFGRLFYLGDDYQGPIVRRMQTEKLVSFLLIILVPLTFTLLCRLFGVRVRLLPVLA